MNRLSKNIDPNIIDKAKQIATDALRACRTGVGFTAGAHHFVDLWARDSLFATFGANLADSKKTLDTFFQYQRPDGLIPYRILLSPTTIGKYFGKPRYFRTPKPDFRSHQSGGLVLDGGLMTVIAARRFGSTYEKQIHHVLLWYKKGFGDGLLREWFLCEWADAVMKIGKTLYTNVLYWKATEDKNIAKKVHESFWNGTYFADWVDYKRQDYFAAHPNMLAIIFGLATRSQAKSILSFAEKYCWNGWTLVSNYPMYPFWRIPLQNYLVGLPDYHNGCLWLQPGILYAIALHKVDQKQKALRVLEYIARKIVEHNGVHEVYEKNGQPLRRLFYRSEEPFAWSAGLFLWAEKLLD